jgi:hypothetical protein
MVLFGLAARYLPLFAHHHPNEPAAPAPSGTLALDR